MRRNDVRGQREQSFFCAFFVKHVEIQSSRGSAVGDCCTTGDNPARIFAQ
jgi:hypothetical protein